MVSDDARQVPDDPTDIAAALAAARRNVDAQRTRLEARGHEVGEELLTHWLCEAAWPHMEYALFNRAQEGVVGADWLWWFLDDRGQCFGMLVQAKKLHGSPGNRRIDLKYPDGSGRQMARLFAAADRFDVPSAYVLYCGDYRLRTDLECAEHDPLDCQRCERASVSILSGLAAQTAVRLAPDHQRGQPAIDAYRQAVPLEDMVGPATDPVLDLNLHAVSDELRTFLTEPQDGARGVAKNFFRVIADIRKEQFGAPAVELLRTVGENVMFVDVPADAGHFGRPYYEHVLQGLRHTLPGYVTDLVLHGGDQTAAPEGINAIVVVHV